MTCSSQLRRQLRIRWAVCLFVSNELTLGTEVQVSTEEHVDLGLFVKQRKKDSTLGTGSRLPDLSLTSKSSNKTIQMLLGNEKGFSCIPECSITPRSLVNNWKRLYISSSSKTTPITINEKQTDKQTKKPLPHCYKTNCTGRSGTLVAESTEDPLPSSSCTRPTWPSLAARWRALSPFWEKNKAGLEVEKWKGDRVPIIRKHNPEQTHTHILSLISFYFRFVLFIYLLFCVNWSLFPFREMNFQRQRCSGNAR